MFILVMTFLLTERAAHCNLIKCCDFGENLAFSSSNSGEGQEFVHRLTFRGQTGQKCGKDKHNKRKYDYQNSLFKLYINDFIS